MNIKQAKSIPIETFLTSLGHSPASKKQNELWYRSPLREGDSSPSFKVNLIKNTWYDFGIGFGGTIIDLSCSIFNEDAGEALRRISSMYGNVPLSKFTISHQTPAIKEKDKSLVLVHSGELTNQVLLDYLSSRNINLQVAKKYCLEADFKLPDDNWIQKAIGFKSDDGGFEIRNKNFKGFIGKKKAISSINIQEKNTVSVFEGFIDFLSFLSDYQITDFQNSVIILNSVNMKDQAKEILQSVKFSKAYFFLDNDKMGKATFEYLTEGLNYDFFDKSVMYENHNDYNEYLKSKKIV